MEWILDPKGKSVANSAQKVVADMHRDLDKYKGRVRDLEGLVTNLQELCTESLENELFRLEMRRKELLLELESTDTAILDKQTRLDAARDNVRGIFLNSNIGSTTPTRGTPALRIDNGSEQKKSERSPSFSTQDANSTNATSAVIANRSRTTSTELKSASLEAQYTEETEMLQVVKNSVDKQVLFVVHCSEIDDVVIYYPSSSAQQVLECKKIAEFEPEPGETSVTQLELTSFENMMSYGAKIVPNHDRDYPHVKEMALPPWFKGGSNSSSDKKSTGQLVGAIQLPVTPDVIIDVWQLSPSSPSSRDQSRCWATTTVDGVSFAVLERIFMISESKWGVSTVTQVDLFGTCGYKKMGDRFNKPFEAFARNAARLNWWSVLRRVEHGLGICVALVAVNTVANEGVGGVARDFVRLLRKLPFVNMIIAGVLEGEVNDAMKLLAGIEEEEGNNNKNNIIAIPEEGVSPQAVVKILESIKEKETAAEDGKAFAYTYTTKTDMAEFAKSMGIAYKEFTGSSHSQSESHENMLTNTWDLFMHSNGLNPMMYPSLRRFETEVVSMSAWMVNGDENTAGSLTSGGTESILMAIKAYRDMARVKRPHVTKPNMIVPTTIHPAFEKAAHYFNVEIKHVAVGKDMRADMNEVRKALDRNTILLVGSAPQYCHGVVDPIEELAALATAKGLPLHVDACFGGFMLPWLEKLGKKIPLWDFRVPGVTSISADIHKYGYSSKGASVILYKNASLRAYQYFAYAEWPGGLFGSPSLAGSRPGGMIASAWAALVGMGQSGYLKMAKSVLETTEKLCAGVEATEGIRLQVQPDMTALSIAASDDDMAVNVLAVADVMEEQSGWKMERQQLPDTLHLSVLPQHARTADQFVIDLKNAVAYVRAHPETANQGTTGVYGMVAKVPDKGIITEFISKFFGSLYTLDKGKSVLEEYGDLVVAESKN